MTLEQAATAVFQYVRAKPYDGGKYQMNEGSWLDRLDDCLADIRSELADAGSCDQKWGEYLDRAGADE